MSKKKLKNNSNQNVEKKNEILNKIDEQLKKDDSAETDEKKEDESAEADEKKEDESAEADKKKEDVEADEKKEDDSAETDDKKEDDKSDTFSDLEATAPIYIDPGVVDYKKKKKKRIIIAGISIIVILALLTSVYLAGYFQHKQKFAKNTKINGIDVSGLSVEEAENLLFADAKTYSLKVVFKNSEQILKYDDSVITITLGRDIGELHRKQNAKLWFLNIGDTYTYGFDYIITYNEEDLYNFIANLPEFNPLNVVKSTDASVIIGDGELVITEDTVGTELNKDLAISAIIEAIDLKQTEIVLDEETYYKKAEITMDSELIQNSIANGEAYLNMDAKYSYKDTEFSIDKSQLSAMAYLDENGEIALYEEAVTAYVDSISGMFPSVTNDVSSRPFRTHDGRDIQIETKRKGYIFDPVAEVQELSNHLLAKVDFVKEPAYRARTTTVGTNTEVGGDYIEIDLSAQHVYVFIGGECVYDTDCVSGCVAWGMSTPAGIYTMPYKMTNATLVGANYVTVVNYWMPFNGGIGLHDATWRGAFGGNIYTYDGSHGCINLSYDAASTIYNIVYGGIPVVCYWN